MCSEETTESWSGLLRNYLEIKEKDDVPMFSCYFTMNDGIPGKYRVKVEYYEPGLLYYLEPME